MEIAEVLTNYAMDNIFAIGLVVIIVVLLLLMTLIEK